MKNNSCEIAILGGTSHIARNLAVRFLRDGFLVALYCRKESREFPVPENARRLEYAALASQKHSVLINCVGAGTPSKLRPGEWFSIPERFDALALDYLQRINPAALYVNFSSGAVYGSHAEPAGDATEFSVPVNRIPASAGYAIMRLYTETKHRTLAALNIADVRIFSFFSRYLAPDAGYFMSDVVQALLQKRPLLTNPGDMVRDYVAPEDLYRLLRLCMEQEHFNAAIDAYSLAPAAKSEILARFRAEFGLEVEYGQSAASPNGERSCYYSKSREAERLLGYKPQSDSLTTLLEETRAALRS